VLETPEVFLANVEGPWIHPDAAPLDRLLHVARSCPSGAITYDRLDGGAQEDAPPVNAPLPMRRLGEQAVLRWHSREERIRSGRGVKGCLACRWRSAAVGSSRRPFTSSAQEIEARAERRTGQRDEGDAGRRAILIACPALSQSA